jgi:hypothetical protein
MTEPRREAEPAAAHEASTPAAAPNPPAATPPPAEYSQPAPAAGAYAQPGGSFQPAWRPPREPWINPNRRAHVALVAVVGAAAVFVVGLTGGWVAGHRHHGFGPERGYPGYYEPRPPMHLPWPERSYLPPGVPVTPVPTATTSAPTPTPSPTSSTR